jgi:hypothetical protein
LNQVAIAGLSHKSWCFADARALVA